MNPDHAKALTDLLITLLTGNMIMHRCHNLVAGPTFKVSHELFGSAYKAHDDAYDTIVEGMIGLDVKPDIIAIAKAAVAQLGEQHPTIDGGYQALLHIEEAVREQINALRDTDLDEAMKNRLAGVADASLQRTYFAKQSLG